jgi:predicted RecB family nuclease
MQNWPITQLPGLSLADQQALEQAGIHTTLDLLRHTSNPVQQEQLGGRLKVNVRSIRKWRALADLARLPGINCEYCGLLLHAGMSSTVHLAHASAPKLHQQLLRLQVTVLRRRDLCPSVHQVAQWIAWARKFQQS